jgi:hypothetical protein
VGNADKERFSESSLRVLYYRSWKFLWKTKTSEMLDKPPPLTIPGDRWNAPLLRQKVRAPDQRTLASRHGTAQ